MEIFEFVIKPSNVISPLCYSIFRLEPFDTCSYGCVYCYARWYRGECSKPRPKRWVVKEFERLARRTRRKYYFRLATLSEPFQEPYSITLKLLRIALKYEIPIIINTKSINVIKPDVLSLLKSMASRSLLLVQVSISSIMYSKLLEPGAPDAWARLEVVRRLTSEGIPTVVRVQPLFPGLEEEHLRVAEEALELGAKGLIGESFRGTKKDIETVYKLLGIKPEVEWVPYQVHEVEGKEPLYHPERGWRERIHASLASLAQVYGKYYADCKDSCTWYGLGRDCCMGWLAFKDFALRYTLREKVAGVPCAEPYVCNDEPPLGRALRMHYRKAMKAEKYKEKLCSLEVPFKAP